MLYINILYIICTTYIICYARQGGRKSEGGEACRSPAEGQLEIQIENLSQQTQTTKQSLSCCQRNQFFHNCFSKVGNGESEETSVRFSAASPQVCKRGPGLLQDELALGVRCVF